MTANESLQRRIQKALQWEPLLHTSEIGVTAKDGVITLSGTVSCPAKKAQAEEAVKKVLGVRALVENIEISNSAPGSDNDNEIAKQVINALQWNTEIAAEKIQVKVVSGWVTLSGEVAWKQQKETAKKAIINMIGVRGVINNIAICPNPDHQISIKDIMAALLRSGSVNAEGVHIETEGNTVILLGKIDSWYEKEEWQRLSGMRRELQKSITALR